MMTYKTIFKGRLDFGNEKSYEKVLKMFQHRVESYYKSDILLDEEEIFDEGTKSLIVPRTITQGSKKSWSNTISVLEYVAQFAVAGEMGAWMTENGKILDHGFVEPNSERAAVQAFIKGRSLVEETGKENEAVEALNKAIEKYEKHSEAYERRAFVKMQLKDYKGALKDYTKSIAGNPVNSRAYYGRAEVKRILEIEEGRLEDLENAVKSTIPLQPLFWQARRKKAEYFLERGDSKGALLDLRLFCHRQFKEDNPNFGFKKYMLFEYGKALAATDSPKEAEEAFTKAMLIEDCDRISTLEVLKERAKVRGEHKFTGAKKDLKTIKEMEKALAK